MKKNTVLSIAIICLALPVLSKIPLKKAIESGVMKNYGMNNLILDEKISAKEKEMMKREALFKLDLNGSYLYRSEKIHMQLPDVVVSPQVTIPGMSFDAGTLHNFDINLSVKQPLFTGNIISNSVKVFEEKRGVNLNAAALMKLRISTLIKSSYFRYHLLKNRMRSILVVNDKIRTHLTKVKDLLAEGLAGESDLLETRSKAGELELELNEVTAEISEEKSRFLELCGINVEDVESGYSERTDSKRESFKAFVSGHPSLKIYEKSEKIFDLNKKIVSGKYLPQIALFSELHYGKPGINFFENRWQFYLQAGLSMSFKIFDWGRRDSERELIDYKKLKLENERKDLISKTKLKLDELFRKIQLLEKSIERVDRLRNDAVRNSQIKKNLYSEKQISNLDYLDSILNVKKYETLKSKIVLQLELVKVSLNNLVGREVTQ